MAKLEHKVTKEKSLLFDVEILDERSNYGYDEYLIKPLKGKGKAWVRNLKK